MMSQEMERFLRKRSAAPTDGAAQVLRLGEGIKDKEDVGMRGLKE